MAGSLVIVHLPQAIYHRLEQAAARLRKPVDTLLAETLEAALPDESGIAPELIAAMKAVELLDKRGLQQVIAADMQTEDQAALDDLLDMQSARSLTGDETAQLDSLRREYERLLLRKARAFALLAEKYPATNTN
ncbi:MAG: hypothetical protein AAB342_01580 [Chloroflexota bacterium]